MNILVLTGFVENTDSISDVIFSKNKFSTNFKFYEPWNFKDLNNLKAIRTLLIGFGFS